MNNKIPPHNQKLSIKEKAELGLLKIKFRDLINGIKDTKDFDLTPVFPNTTNLNELHEQLSELKKCINSFRPLNKSQLRNLQEAFDTEYTFESNRIEGNTLTLMETDLVLHKGITIAGKSMKEHQEVLNHQEAIDLIREIAQDNVEFNEKTLLNIHSLILQSIDRLNAGIYRTERVRIVGSRHICPNPIKVPELMDEYFRFFEDNKNSMHPVELATNMHEKLVTIHPFIDGNGRTARLVMNLILLQRGYPITIIASENINRAEYYKTLESAQISDPRDNIDFQILIAEYVKEWMFKYLNMFAASINNESEGKGYYFFKNIEPYLK